MCDLHDTLQSSLVFVMLSLISSNVFRYIALSIASISLAIYSLHRYRPSVRLSKRNGGIIIAGEVLASVETKCMRDHLLLAETEIRLLRTKLWTSQIHSHLLEISNMSWMMYLQNMITILRSLAMSGRELRGIQRSLSLLIEAAYQHRLAEDINGGRDWEIEDKPSPSPHSCTCLHLEYL
ncbi:hypothetical protein DFH08DRAFT_866694 [Mycena albidolilacea]|uniref:Uncharacterized protein n=1 Tax=Mycena albidolilacea TaxID=1033008 RepID=A0AAD7A220_9AGAR|nr:hypothetical protein DFH08DRAFT_866694 [Mycena albidolilacea]